MKQRSFRRCAAGLCLFILMMILSVYPVAAQSSGIDFSKPASLTLNEISCNTAKPIAGLELSIYRVATFTGSAGSSYALIKEFSACGVDINDIATSEKQLDAASKVMVYINENSITGNTVVSDANGSAVFNNLPLGLYLVRISSHDASVKVASGLFFVSLPMADNGVWQYNVVAQPKSVFNTEGDKVVTTVHTVRKIWKDSNHMQSRPSDIKVGLYRGSVLVDTVTLNDVNNWSYTWSGLSDNFVWTVKEPTVPPNYTATINDSGTLSTITNTYTSHEEVPLSVFPQTGENTTWLLICFGIMSFCITFCLVEILADRRKKKNSA